MKNKDENIVASVRQKLINLSRERGEDPNLVFIRYAIERLLPNMPEGFIVIITVKAKLLFMIMLI